MRVNAYVQRGAVSAALRVIPSDIKSLEHLGMPSIVREMASLPRGIVLVTGPTGSGKSTTLAALIDEINNTREDHILTIEDPIEFLHSHKRCLVNQRELGSDATGFAEGLRAALREDPDVILVGEMRDLETISTALTAAETGHLVLATLHTQDAPQTVDRIIDVFPPHQQQHVRVMLSVALQGVVAQQLLPTADGSGRVPAVEILIPTPAVRNLIREGKTHQIYSAIQTGGEHGMQTMDAALTELVRGGRISRDVARRRASVPAELERLLGGGHCDGDRPAPMAPTCNERELRIPRRRQPRRQAQGGGGGRFPGGRDRAVEGAGPHRPGGQAQEQVDGALLRRVHAGEAGGPGADDASAIDDDLVRPVADARTHGAGDPDREQAPQDDRRSDPTAHRERRVSLGRLRAPSQDLLRALRGDDPCR